MRRFSLICLCLALPGCGYNTWSDPPFATARNPNFPADASENVRRVMGEQVEAPTLTPEPGDIWPGPLPPSPTLQDLEVGNRIDATLRSSPKLETNRRHPGATRVARRAARPADAKEEAGARARIYAEPVLKRTTGGV